MKIPIVGEWDASLQTSIASLIQEVLGVDPTERPTAKDLTKRFNYALKWAWLKGLSDEEKTYYVERIENTPDDRIVWNELTKRYKQKKDYDTTIEVYQTWRERYPTCESAVCGLGQLYYLIGEFQKAVECFESVQDPTWSVRYWRYFGKSYVESGRVSEAIILYSSALEKNVTDKMLLWLDLTELLKRKGQWESAMIESEKAVDLYTKVLEANLNTEILNDLGVIYYAKGAYDEAIQMYERENKIEPDERAWWNRLGHCYRAKGLLSQAIPLYDKLVEANPSNLHAAVNDILHHFIYCDKCGENPIRGLWYKCFVCFDYDICGNCAKRSSYLHSGHCLFTIPSAEWIFRFGTKNLACIYIGLKQN